MISFDNDNDEHSFHDDLVLGVRVNAVGDKAEIQIISADLSTESTIVLDGVFVLRMDNFREGNVISTAETWDWSEIPMEKLASFTYMEVEEFMRSKYVESYKKIINTNKLFLFRIIPAYGCYLLSLCKHVYVSIGNNCET